MDVDRLLKPTVSTDSPAPPKSTTDADTLDLLRITEDQLRRSIKRYQRNTNELVLEMLDDLPQKGVRPPNNALFVCKLNRLTTSE